MPRERHDEKDRRYNVWGGNPKGTPEDPDYCIADVWHNHLSYQCSRKRGHGPKGLYCWHHDPVRLATLDEARRKSWQEKWDASERERKHKKAVEAFKDECVRAVREVAAGYNDARTLCVELLAKEPKEP